MEIKQLLEIMLNNVNQGRDAAHGLIGYNGVISVHNPEQVHLKPPVHITFDEFREIRNTPDHNTAHNRLNLAVDKIVEKLLQERGSDVKLTPPEGYVFKDKFFDQIQEGRDYTSFIRSGWSNTQLSAEGYLLPVAKKSAPAPLKPYVNWVNSTCEFKWPNAGYFFMESQFSSIHPSEFRVILISALFDRLEGDCLFDNVVRNTYTGRKESEIIEMEQKVNDILNKLYQKL